MADTVFINYRRAENSESAIALHQRLQRHFARRRLFIDLHGLDGGVDWLHELERQVAASGVLLALIGSGWVDIQAADGTRRLDDAGDFVRVEIAEALRRRIPIIPVMLNDAPMPPADTLPPSIQQLAYQQGMPLRTISFEQDADRIAQAAKARIAEQRRRGVPTGAAILIAALCVTGGIAAGPYVLSQLGVALPGTSIGSDGASGLQSQLAEVRQKLASAQRVLDEAKRGEAAAVKRANEARAKAADLEGVLRRVQRSLADTKTALIAAERREAAALKSAQETRAKNVGPATPSRRGDGGGGRTLGMLLAPAASQLGENVRGVIVKGLTLGSAAISSGIRVGDVIEQAHGKQVSQPRDVAARANELRALGHSSMILHVVSGSRINMVELPIP